MVSMPLVVDMSNNALLAAGGVNRPQFAHNDLGPTLRWKTCFGNIKLRPQFGRGSKSLAPSLAGGLQTADGVVDAAAPTMCMGAEKE